MVAAQTAPIKQAQTTYDQGSQQQQQNVTGLTSALAGILGGIAPQVQGTYKQASDNQAGFAKGYSDFMQQQLAQNAGSTSDYLKNIVGAPSSQITQVADQVGAPHAGDTSYALGGYIPASTLNEEGAAYTANAQQLPAIANSQGLRQIGSIQGAQQKQDADFANQIATVAGQIPKLTNDLTNTAFDHNFKVGQANEHIAEFNAKQTMAQQVNTFNQKYKVDTLKLRGQSLQLQANKFAQTTLNQNRSYGIALANLGLRTAADKRAALASEYKLKTGGFTPSQVAKYNSLLQQGIDTLPVGTTYQQFVSKSIEHGVPLSMAVDRANAHWPATQRPDPGSLSDALGITTGQAAADTQFPAQLQDYNQTVGASSPLLAKVQPLIIKEAGRLGLDAQAVIAVSQMEGAGGGIGDNGTSFGPWQLHIGGALPKGVGAKGAAYAHAWAWSPAGIKYALNVMSHVASGLTGPAAVEAIVRKFERPANPSAEVAGATTKYGNG